jgi:hypothetical protein
MQDYVEHVPYPSPVDTHPYNASINACTSGRAEDPSQALASEPGYHLTLQVLQSSASRGMRGTCSITFMGIIRCSAPPALSIFSAPLTATPTT